MKTKLSRREEKIHYFQINYKMISFDDHKESSLTTYKLSDRFVMIQMKCFLTIFFLDAVLFLVKQIVNVLFQ